MSVFPLLDKSIKKGVELKSERQIMVECSTAFARYGKYEVCDLDSAYELCESFIKDNLDSHPMCWVYVYKPDIQCRGGYICDCSAVVTQKGIKEYDSYAIK